MGQDNNVPLSAWSSRQRFASLHLLFLSPNLGINLFVSTAEENQLIKGTAGVRNAGISFEGIHTDIPCDIQPAPCKAQGKYAE